MTRTTILFALMCCLVLVDPAWGWNHTGHRVHGWITYQRLDPQTRAAVDRILRAHPRYEQDLLQRMPEGFREPTLWAFATACTWPDMLRSQAHPMHRSHHRGHWHFINITFVQPGDDPQLLQIPEPSPMQWDGQSDDPANAVVALQMLASRLADPDRPDELKAIDLCWYLHLVGDIHQPLHATTRFSALHPEGDRGGNSVLVARMGSVINLHAYWDNLLGGYDQPPILGHIAWRVTHDHPAAAADSANLDYAAWALESYELGVRYAYLEGRLTGAPRGRGNEPLEGFTVPELPAGYEQTARLIAAHRVAQAGHRAAADLQRLLAREPTRARR